VYQKISKVDSPRVLKNGMKIEYPNTNNTTMHYIDKNRNQD
jgi:hypothetical protein